MPNDSRRLDPRWVEARFDRIVGSYRFFEWLYAVPHDLRAIAIARLGLIPGERVLSVGCGQGPCLRLLSSSVGEQGHVLGVDLSRNMLDRAAKVVASNTLRNVELLHADIQDVATTEPWNAIFFGFSFTSFGEPGRALHQAWEQLAPGGRIVVMDAQVPPWLPRWVKRPLMPMLRRFQEATVLGDPDMPTLDILRAVDPAMQVEFFRARCYFIAQLEKR